MPATKAAKAVPLGGEELDGYCEVHAQAGLQTQKYIGGKQIREVWYLAHRDGKYLLVSADNLEYDAHPGETKQLRGGELVIINDTDTLRKIQL